MNMKVLNKLQSTEKILAVRISKSPLMSHLPLNLRLKQVRGLLVLSLFSP